jgi:hypothetical protein
LVVVLYDGEHDATPKSSISSNFLCGSRAWYGFAEFTRLSDFR